MIQLEIGESKLLTWPTHFEAKGKTFWILRWHCCSCLPALPRLWGPSSCHHSRRELNHSYWHYPLGEKSQAMNLRHFDTHLRTFVLKWEFSPWRPPRDMDLLGQNCLEPPDKFHYLEYRILCPLNAGKFYTAQPMCECLSNHLQLTGTGRADWAIENQNVLQLKAWRSESNDCPFESRGTLHWSKTTR